MKIFIMVIILVICCSALSSLDFEWINPYPTGNCLRDVQFIDTLVGWFVGDAGTIVKTTDAGDSWDIIDLDTRINLTGIYLLDEHKCWIVGDSGLILHTSDGGVNWTVQSSGLADHFSDVNFSDSVHGCAVGKQGVIYITQDGGDNWTKCDSFTHHNLQSVYFTDSILGWAAGDSGIILHTVNGGFQWVQQNSAITWNLNEIEFYNNQLGWCVGYGGTALKTTNAGAIWYQANFPAGRVVRSMSVVDSNNLWSFIEWADVHSLCRSTDGGENWSGVSSLLTNDLYSLNFIDNDNGWIVGENGNIFNITDQGSTWERKNFTLMNFYYNYIGDAFFIDDSLGWFVGDCRYVYKTTDGGETFDSFYTETDYFNSIFFINENKGCIAGIDQWPPDMLVTNMYTTDGGVNWTAGDDTYGLYDIFFSSESLGWAVGGLWGNNWIYRTTDLGVNWDGVYKTSYLCYSIHFVDCSQGWAVGYDGYMIVSSDSGTTWTSQNSGTTNTLNSVFFLDLNTGFAAGIGGTIVKTTDGGNQWVVQTSNISGDFNSIIFLNPDIGWAVGDSGIMVSTSDGGITWIEVNSKTNKNLLSITLAGSSFAWLVGDGAVILRANIGSVGISEQNPGISVNSFQINYSSIICNGVVEFEISVIEDCNLKIDLFNIAGQNIGTILDQRIYVGSNKYSINISERIGNVSSGIYFLNFTTDSDTEHFQQRNKLMLIN